MTKKIENSTKEKYDPDRVKISKDGIVSLNLSSKKVRENIQAKAKLLKGFKIAAN